MNEINEVEDNTMLDASFNQDNSCFAIGTENGFKIYQTHPFKGPHIRKMNGGIGRAEMLYKSNFLALIGGGKIPKYNNNKVVIWDDHEKKVISELKFITPVINVKLKKDLIFIICQKRIYVFNFNTYDIIETLDTCDNKKGLIAINNAPDFTVLVYPGLKENKVTINDFKQKKTQTIIAQDDKVSYLAINYNGTLLATSNEKGNIIKIYSCSDGAFLKVFKRGSGKVDYIYICFDNDNKFMAVSSNKGTIHIFSMGSTIKKLKELEKKEDKDKKKVDIKNEQENEVKDEKKVDKKNEQKSEIKDEKEINFFLSEKNGENDGDNKEGEDEGKEKKDEEKNEDKDKEKKINEGIENNENKINDNIINDDEEINKNLEKESDKGDLPKNTKTYLGYIGLSQTEKSFAQFKTKNPCKNICSFIGHNMISIITFNNKYYLAEIDLKNGGNCKKILEEDLVNKDIKK
jgi:hypothetical protein